MLAQFDETETEFLETLLESGQNLPQNKQELVQSLLDDLSLGDDTQLQALLLESSSSIHSSLISALLNGEDAENIVQLLGAIDSSDEQFIKFLSALRTKIHSDPEKLERIRNNMSIVYADVLATPVRLPALGARFMQSSMLNLAVISLAYSNYPDIVTSVMHGNDMAFIPYFVGMLGMFVLSTATEIRVYFRSWRAYKQSLTQRRRAERHLDSFIKLVSALQSSPDLIPMIDRMKYFASPYAENAALQALAEYPDRMVQDMEFLTQNSDHWAHMSRFYKTRQFYDLIEKYNERLTETDKEILLTYYQEGKNLHELPIHIREEQLNFERRVMTYFNQWMQTEGHTGFNEQFRRLLSRKTQEVEFLNDVSLPRNAYGLMTTCLGLSMAILSIHLGVEATTQYQGFNAFFDHISDFLMKHSNASMYFLASLVVVPMSYMAYTERRLRHRMKALRFHVHYDLNELLALTRGMPRWTQRQGRIANPVAPMCRAIF